MPAAPALDIVVPVYNEQAALAGCVRRLRSYLSTEVPYTARITIADNASTDRTLGIAQALADEFDDVRVLHLDEKGRGRALRAAWSRSDARVLVYMDVDLSTGLDALLPLVAPLLSGHSDLAIGSRLAPSARVVRGLKREFISRGYNLILRRTLHAHFSDAQCGFKAVRAEVARALLPLVEDGGWFFDTELLVLAERAGMRIHEVPVDWVDDPDSRSTSSRPPSPICRASRAWGGRWRRVRCRSRRCGRVSGAACCSAGRRPRCWGNWCGSPSSASRAPSRTRCCTWHCTAHWVRSGISLPH